MLLYMSNDGFLFFINLFIFHINTFSVFKNKITLYKMSCDICCLNYTNIIRKKITCTSCNGSCCKVCIKNWCNEKINVVCPLCNVEFGFNFCIEKLGQTFMMEYKEIQKEILYRRELDFIKDTQIFIEIGKKFRELNNEYTRLVQHYHTVTTMRNIQNISNIPQIKSFFEKLDITDFSKLTKADAKLYLSDYLNALRIKKQAYENSYRLADVSFIEQIDDNLLYQKSKSVTYIIPCPASQCKGYIQSLDYDCGICSLKVCKSCHRVITDEHQCLKEDIDSVTLILKESKPCPKCATRISKIDGCDQMYCVQCNTAFSWKTLQIETGRIHNPHYYEQLRNRGFVIPREQGDNPECQNPDNILYNDYIDSDSNLLLSASFGQSLELLRDTVAVYNSQIRKFYHNVYSIQNINIHTNPFKINYSNRLQYMTNRTSEQLFKKNLYTTFKSQKYKQEVKDEVIAFNETFKLLLLRASEELIKFLIELNSQLKTVYQNYKPHNNICPQIDIIMSMYNNLYNLFASKFDKRNVPDTDEDMKKRISLQNEIINEIDKMSTTVRKNANSRLISIWKDITIPEYIIITRSNYHYKVKAIKKRLDDFGENYKYADLKHNINFQDFNSYKKYTEIKNIINELDTQKNNNLKSISKKYGIRTLNSMLIDI